MIFSVYFNLRTCIFVVHNTLTRVYFNFFFIGSYCNYRSYLCFFLCRIGNNNSAGCFRFRFFRFYQNTICLILQKEIILMYTKYTKKVGARQLQLHFKFFHFFCKAFYVLLVFIRYFAYFLYRIVYLYHTRSHFIHA